MENILIGFIFIIGIIVITSIINEKKLHIQQDIALVLVSFIISAKNIAPIASLASISIIVIISSIIKGAASENYNNIIYNNSSRIINK